MLDYGKDYKWARHKLIGSVVSWMGKPVLVDDIDLQCHVTVNILGKGKYLGLELKDLDLTPLSLGNANYQGSCSYLSRLPLRQWRQGLTTRNVRGNPFNVPFSSRSFVDTIIGKYPIPVKCLETLICEESEHVALSRDFSLIKGGQMWRGDLVEVTGDAELMYRHRPVGSVTWNDKANNLNYQLAEDFNFLREVLEDSINV